jgi:hypothetical protein
VYSESKGLANVVMADTGLLFLFCLRQGQLFLLSVLGERMNKGNEKDGVESMESVGEKCSVGV